MRLTEENGWSEYKVFVKDKLEEHSERLQAIAEQISLIHADLAVQKLKLGVWGFLAGSIPILIYLLISLISRGKL